MRDLDVRPPRRVHGRDRLEQRIRGLLVHAGRFSQHRAQSAADKLWSARVADALRDLLNISPQPADAFGQPRSVWESDESRSEDRP